MKLVGVICSHETRCQIVVQNVTELRPKSVNRTRIEGGEVCSKPIPSIPTCAFSNNLTPFCYKSVPKTLQTAAKQQNGYPSRRSRISTAPAGEIEQELITEK